MNSTLPQNQSPARRVGFSFDELLNQSPHLRDVQELAGRTTFTAIEVPGCGVHGGDEFRLYGKSAREKAVVRFVPDDTELRKRIANGEASTISATKVRLTA